MPKLPISFLILTKNSAAYLKAALESIKFADEIIILDDGSSDETISIAKKYTNKIISDLKSTKNFAHKRNILKKQVKNDWLFYLDADERVPLQLKEEITRVVNNNDPAVYKLNRLNIFWGKLFFHGGWSPDWVIRLFHVSKLKNWQGQLHEQPNFEGKLMSLKTPLIHLSHSSLSKSLANSLSWSWLEAKLLYDNHHPQIRWYHFISAPLREFGYRFIKKAGYKDGLEGFLESIMQAISKFMTYERLWELQNGKLKDKYNLIDRQLINNNFDLKSIVHE